MTSRSGEELVRNSERRVCHSVNISVFLMARLSLVSYREMFVLGSFNRRPAVVDLSKKKENNMKKLLAASALLASSASFAVAPGGPNCGWGNMLFAGQSGLPSHLIASITNGTTGNNTFGMTLGTNGCSTGGALTYGGKSMINLGAIMDEFSEDVARGDGEALTAVAVSMGIQSEDRAVFKSVMQDNFDTLFPSAEVSAEDVFASMLTVMREDARLAKYVA